MWRNTMQPIRLWVIDAKALIPFAIFMVHWSILTLEIAGAGIVLFGALEWFGVNVAAAFKIVRGWIYGPVRHAVPPGRKRRLA
jgi:intracellular multiplication protein IcmT